MGARTPVVVFGDGAKLHDLQGRDVRGARTGGTRDLLAGTDEP
jgi:hypothetical protein